MFDIGWSELMIIAVLAIIVVGPRDLPRMMRTVGQYVSKMKSMARDFQRQFDDAVREADLDDVRKTMTDIKSGNPLNDIKKSVTQPFSEAASDLKSSVDDIEKSVKTGDAKPTSDDGASADASAQVSDSGSDPKASVDSTNGSGDAPASSTNGAVEPAETTAASDAAETPVEPATDGEATSPEKETPSPMRPIASADLSADKEPVPEPAKTAASGQ